MNVFVDENLTSRTGVRSEPVKPTHQTTKKFGQTVNPNQIQSKIAPSATKLTNRDPTRKKKKRSSKRDVETAHFDTFNRDTSFLSSVHSNEMSFWKSSLSKGSLFKRNYKTDVDLMLKKELTTFSMDCDDFSSNFNIDDDIPLDLDNEVVESIDDLLAGL